MEAVNKGLHRERLAQYTTAPIAYLKGTSGVVTTVALSAAAGEVDTDAIIEVAPKPMTAAERRAERMKRRDERRKARLASRRFVTRTAVTTPKKTPDPVVKREQIVSAAQTHAGTSDPSQVVMNVLVQHDGSFSGRAWETLRVILVDDQGNTIVDPILKKNITLRTSFGSAEFQPGTLTEDDFTAGIAEVKMLPRGRQTIVVQPFPFTETVGSPMRYERCLFGC